MRAQALAVLMPIAVGSMLLASAPRSARAQDDDRSAAEARFRQGMAAASEERWEAALAAFEEAFALAPIPDILLNIGSARGNLGRIVEGRQAYRELLRRADTEEISNRVVEAARSALARLDARVGRVRVQVENAVTGDAVSLCDAGEQECRDIRPDDIAGLEVDPGEYVVVLRRGTEAVERSSISVDEGAVEYVHLVAPAPEPARAQITPPAQSTFASGPPVRTSDTGRDDDGGSVFGSPWFWITVSVVAVLGAGVGIFFGAGLNEADPILGNVGPGISTVR